jgi:hypothetical protein
MLYQWGEKSVYNINILYLIQENQKWNELYKFSSKKSLQHSVHPSDAYPRINNVGSIHYLKSNGKERSTGLPVPIVGLRSASQTIVRTGHTVRNSYFMHYHSSLELQRIVILSS